MSSNNDIFMLIKFILIIIVVVLIWMIIHFKICVKYNQRSIFDNPSKYNDDEEDEDNDNIITNRSFNIYENTRKISHV